MHNIEMQEMSPDFLKCWQAAGMRCSLKASVLNVPEHLA